MKIYLAARYSRNEEMRSYRDDLEALGHQVTSRWIDQHGGDLLESIVGAKLNSDPEDCSKYGKADIQDLRAAEIVISFTAPTNGGKGGRHVEFGMAWAMGKRLMLVGPRENVFHTLAEVDQFNTWAECRKVLAIEANRCHRLLGANLSISGESISVHHCRTDLLPMTLDWITAGVPASFMTRAHHRMGAHDGAGVI